MERVLKNADISIMSNFLAFFSNFFLDIEKFYLVLSIRLTGPFKQKLQRGWGQNLP